MAERMDVATRQELIVAIAGREGTAGELAERFNMSVAKLHVFTRSHLPEIELAAQGLEEPNNEPEMDVVTPAQLSDLWISNKSARLKRFEMIANKLFFAIMAGTLDAVILREFRFYSQGAANELGQLLHRGAGEQSDGDKLSVEFIGVDPESFR